MTLRLLERFERFLEESFPTPPDYKPDFADSVEQRSHRADCVAAGYHLKPWVNPLSVLTLSPVEGFTTTIPNPPIMRCEHCGEVYSADEPVTPYAMV